MMDIYEKDDNLRPKSGRNEIGYNSLNPRKIPYKGSFDLID